MEVILWDMISWQSKSLNSRYVKRGTAVYRHENKHTTFWCPDLKVYYTMTSVKISGEKGCWEMCNFSTPSEPHSNELWNKSKNPYPLRNRIIPNSATACGLVVPGTQLLPHWELCNISNLDDKHDGVRCAMMFNGLPMKNCVFDLQQDV